MKALASANALVTLTGNRRMAMWDAAASVPERDLIHATAIADPMLELAPPTEADGIVASKKKWKIKSCSCGRFNQLFSRFSLWQRKAGRLGNLSYDN